MTPLRILAVPTAALFIVAGTANAADVRSRVVSYADLDLSKPSATVKLAERIRNAAHAVCGTADARSLTDLAAAKRCADAATSDAMARAEIAQSSARLARTVTAGL